MDSDQSEAEERFLGLQFWPHILFHYCPIFQHSNPISPAFPYEMDFSAPRSERTILRKPFLMHI